MNGTHGTTIYKTIKEGLESMLKDKPEYPRRGICANLDAYLTQRDEGGCMYAYDFVYFNCVGWKGIVDPLDWPIAAVRQREGILWDLGRWQGYELDLRRSLIKYLIERIESGNVDESIRDHND